MQAFTALTSIQHVVNGLLEGPRVDRFAQTIENAKAFRQIRHGIARCEDEGNAMAMQVLGKVVGLDTTAEASRP